MEGVATAGQGQSSVLETSLGRPSPSFRLRTESLNTLRLRRIFDVFDRNGDGEITVEEIALALDRLGLGADRAEVRATVEEYIPTGCAGLAFADFEALHRALGDDLFGGQPDAVEEAEEEEDMRKAEEEEDMREAFRVFDDDGDGFISAEELQTVLSKLGFPEASSLASVQEMICSVDRNSDGQVDFGEFKHMMQGITVWGA